MKKRIVWIVCALLLALCLTAAAAEEGPDAGAPTEEGTDAAAEMLIDAAAFPDAAFRAWVLENLPHETNASGAPYMTRAQIDSVTEIDCQGCGIAKLNGVGKFRMLESLNCSGNTLVSLDLSGNPNLRVLDCSGNRLERLVLTRCIQLEGLDCSGNALASLDLSECCILSTLHCENNALETLDLRNNLRLEEINCLHNRLTALLSEQNRNLRRLNCADNALDELTLSLFENLEVLDASCNKIDFLAVYYCPGLHELRCADNRIRELDLNDELIYLDCGGNLLSWLAIPYTVETLILRDNCFSGLFDFERFVNLRYLDCSRNAIDRLRGLSGMEYVDCSYNEIYVLSVGGQIEYLDCRYNELTELDLSECGSLITAELSGQRTVLKSGGTETENGFEAAIGSLVDSPERIRPADPGQQYDPETGIMTVRQKPDYLDYQYDTGKGLMPVRAYMPYERTATIEFCPGEVQYKGDLPYVLYNGERRFPAVRILDEDGSDIDPVRYSVGYSDNREPGTAHVTVRFGERRFERSFKIFLPGTTETSVSNERDGIRITWAKVKGAGGYVIYRRAWSSTTNGWTAFERWNNTTQSTWVDTKVYAGTRYQYGVKAYGELHHPLDNFNLGMVGPLKTTVRITTRELKSVTAGSKRMTVKWAPSKNFTGYQIKYATDENFTKNVKAIKVEDAATASKVVTGLKSGTTYYVTVRSYHVFEGMTYFGEWSNVLSCRVK